MKFHCLKFCLVALVIATSACKESSSDKSSLNRIQPLSRSLKLTDKGSLQGHSDAEFTLVGQAKAPKINGKSLEATKVFVQNRFAYVVYNEPGLAGLGAVETIDVLNAKKTRSLQLLRFRSYKVNAVFATGDRLFIAGHQGHHLKPKGYLRVMKLRNGVPAEQLALITLPHSDASAVFVKDSLIYISSAGDGGLTLLNDSYEVVGESRIFGAQGISAPLFSSSVFVLGGQQGKVNAFSTSALISTRIPQAMVPSGSVHLSKSQRFEIEGDLQSGLQFSLASLGKNGFKIFCNIDGTTLVSQKPPKVKGVSSRENFTKSAVVDEGLLFAGNANGGVQVYALEESSRDESACDNVKIKRLGRLPLGPKVRVNHVEAKNKMLFVASANDGGVKIISVKPGNQKKLVKDFNLKSSDFILPPKVQLFTGKKQRWSSPVAKKNQDGLAYW